MRTVHKILSILLLFNALVLSAQQMNVTGVVFDPEGATLPGVSILVKNTGNGTITDADGNFYLRANKGDVLTVSCIGFKDQEIVVSGQSKLIITMDMDKTALDEVVVIGYGKQSRRTLTSAVSKVEMDDLKNTSITNALGSLNGKVSGARIYNASGQPGESPTVVIRGGSAISGSNAPLILVDGVERSLNTVNPADIESIQILKDAASTAIYGSRASNGIVLVTTANGKRSTKPVITFSTDFSVQDIESYYDFCTTEEYLSIIRPSVARGPNPKWNSNNGYAYSSANSATSAFTTRYLNEGESIPTGWKSMTDPVDPSKTLIYEDHDIIRLAFNPALRQNYHIGVNGGTEMITYSAGIGYTDDAGVAYKTGWNRFSAHAAGDMFITKNFKVFTKFAHQESETDNYSSQANAITRSLYLPGTLRLYYDDGSFASGYNATASSLLWWTNVHQRTNLLKQTTLQGGFNWNILEGLSLNGTASDYISSSQNSTFDRANSFSSARDAYAAFSETQRLLYESTLNYNKAFNEHHLSAMLGASYQVTTVRDLNAKGKGASSDNIETLNASAEPVSVYSYISKETLAGLFSRLQYDYANKYLFSASVRRDGSSRFGKNNKWAWFPSVSAGWLITEEDFMKPAKDILSTLKLRASYGKTGNNSISLYAAEGRYTVDKYNGEAAVYASSMPNQNLRWEVTTQKDAGLDIGLFKDRLNLLVDVYDKVTENLLFSKNLPNTSGFSSVSTNIGSVRFYGFDVEINSQNVRTEDFDWNTTFTWSFVKNKVLKLPDNGQEKNRIGGYTGTDGSRYGGTAEGEPLYTLWGYKVDYLIDNDAQAATALYDESAIGYDYRDGKKIKGRKFAGDYEWVDRDGDGKITSQDMFCLGSSVPHSTGGLNNTFRYRNWTLRVFTDWALGHSMIDVAFKFHMMSTFNGNTILMKEALNAWKQPGDAAKTKWARIAAHDSAENWNYRRDSDAVTFKCDYLCIRDVSLSYALPKSITDRLRMAGCNIFISGNNLHYFSAVKGTPPEVSTDNNNSSTGYPRIMRITGGFNIQF